MGSYQPQPNPNQNAVLANLSGDSL